MIDATDIITWTTVFIMIFAVAAGWAQIAQIVARHRRERNPHKGQEGPIAAFVQPRRF